MRIVTVLAVLAGGRVEPETRVEIPVPDGAVDVSLLAQIRDGRLTIVQQARTPPACPGCYIDVHGLAHRCEAHAVLPPAQAQP